MQKICAQLLFVFFTWPMFSSHAGTIAAAIPDTTPSWRAELQSDLIVVGAPVLDDATRARIAQLNAADDRSRSGEIDVSVQVHSILKGAAKGAVSFRVYVSPHGRQRQVPTFLTEAAKEGSSHDRIFFLEDMPFPTQHDGPRFFLVDGRDEQPVVMPATDAFVTATRELIARHAALALQPVAFEMSDEADATRLKHLIHYLIDRSTQPDISRLIAEICASDPDAMLFLITSIDDHRAIPIPKSASFDFPGGWERAHYDADRVSDILAYILEWLTGEQFGAVVSETRHSQYHRYIPRWRVYAHYLSDHLPAVRESVRREAKK